jgi:hypothetical protein
MVKRQKRDEKIVPIKNARHYIDNVKFLELLREYNAQKKRPKIIGEELGEMFLLLVDNISFSRNFINYSEDWKNEMKSDALYNIIKYVEKFDATKYNNPHAYFTMIAFNAFKMRIKKEKTMLAKDDKLRTEIFDEFLSDEGLYRRSVVEMDDEANHAFQSMDSMKLDIELLEKENEEVKVKEKEDVFR